MQAGVGVVLQVVGLVEPVGDLAHIVGVQADELLVAHVLAVLLEVGDHLLGGVLGHAAVDLQLGAAHDLVAAGHGDGAAQTVGLLKQDDVLALLLKTDGAAHASTAATHDDGVSLELDRLSGLLGLNGSEEGLGGAGLLGGVGHGVDDALGGNRGAGNGVDADALGVNDALDHHVDGTVAHNSGCLGLRGDLDGLECGVGEGHVDDDVAAVTRAGARVGTGSEGKRLLGEGDVLGCAGKCNGAGKTRSRDGETTTGDILRVKALGKFHECHAP